jgi:hypothetical protein
MNNNKEIKNVLKYLIYLIFNKNGKSFINTMKNLKKICLIYDIVSD